MARAQELALLTYRWYDPMLTFHLDLEGPWGGRENVANARWRMPVLASFEGCRYVEVGTWQGATALSASYLNRGSFKAIDNFSEFGGPREVCLRNRERWRAQCHFELIDTV